MLSSFRKGNKETAPDGAASTESDQKLKDLKGKLTKHSNLIGLWAFLLLNAGGLTIVIVLMLVQLVQIGRVANKPPATLVETRDGKGLVVEAMPSTSRTDKAIQRFSYDILGALFTVAPIIIDNDGLSNTGGFDPGVKISLDDGKGNNRVTQNAYIAAMGGLAPGFRDEFLEKLAELYPPGAFNGTTQILFKIDYMGEPIPVKGTVDEWTVTVIATRYVIDSSGVGRGYQIPEPTPFRQVLYLKSVPPQFDPLPELSTSFQEAIFDITSIGLQITKMVPYDSSAPQGSDYLQLPNSLPNSTPNPQVEEKE